VAVKGNYILSPYEKDIRKMYNRKNSAESVTQIARKYKVGKQTVYTFLRHLNIRNSLKNPRKYWTAKEKENLISQISAFPVATISRKSSRTLSAIRQVLYDEKRRLLDLRSEWYTTRDISFILGMHPDSVTSLYKSKKLKARKFSTASKRQYVTRQDLRRYLIDYAHDIRSKNLQFGIIVDILMQKE